MTLSSEIIKSGKFLAESLNIYDQKIDDTIYPELWGYEGKYHAAKGDLPIATNKIVNFRRDFTGKAVNYGGKATTIPLVNYGLTAGESKVLIGTAAADWSWVELMAEAAARNNPFAENANVVESYLTALDRAMREWQHIRTVFGDPALGFSGMFNNPSVEIVSLGIDLYALTSQQFYDFWIDEISKFRRKSFLSSTSTSLIAPESLGLKGRRRFGDNTSDGNTWKLLLEGNGTDDYSSLRNINIVNELQSDILEEYGILPVGTNRDMFILYEQDASTISRRFTPITKTEPRILDDGVTYRVIGFTATSEMMVKQPFRMRYYTFPKATI